MTWQKNMKQKFSTNLTPLNATYASVRLFIRDLNTNSSHFIINSYHKQT